MSVTPHMAEEHSGLRVRVRLTCSLKTFSREEVFRCFIGNEITSGTLCVHAYIHTQRDDLVWQDDPVDKGFMSKHDILYIYTRNNSDFF